MKQDQTPHGADAPCLFLRCPRALKFISFALTSCIFALTGCGSSSGSHLLPESALHASNASGVGQGRSKFQALLAEKPLADMGSAPTAGNVHLLLSIQHRNEAQLQQLIADQENPKSSSYLKFLTPSQFDAQFGALPQTRNQIKTVLAAAGFTVDPDRFGASVIEADGRVSTANAVFGVTLHSVKEPSGRVALAPDMTGTPTLSLPSAVQAVLGLDTISANLPSKMTGAPPPETILTDNAPCSTACSNPAIAIFSAVAPALNNYPAVGPNTPLTPYSKLYSDITIKCFKSGTCGYYPYTYATDFDLPVQHGFAGAPTCGGKSCTAVVLMDSYVAPSDVQTFLAGTNTPSDGGHFTEIGTGSNAADQREATMDVETISALAPGANVKLYRISSLSVDDTVAGMQEADYYNEAAVVSMSFGRCESSISDINFPNPYGAAIAEDAAAEQGSAQGITFAASTGDSGQPKYLSGCASVMAPADSQDVVAVGGTSPYNTNFFAGHAYEMNPSGTGWQYAWGETVNGATTPCATNWCGTGGGESTHFLTGFQHNVYNSSWRAVPDLSMAADVFYPGLIILNGAWSSGNGTSFAVQQFAALQIEIDQRQNTRKGNVVPAIWNAYFTYKYGPLGTGLPRVYDDITQGNTGIQAIVGPDWTSGIGAVDGYGLSSVE